MLLTIILTSWKEEKTIVKALQCLLDPENSGYRGSIQLITVIPDEPTQLAAQKFILKLPQNNFSWESIKDPQKGKPYALNLAFKLAKGAYILLTDGDVYLGKNAVSLLVAIIKQKEAGGVTGRPVATNSRSNIMGYYANLLADAAHHKRTVTMGGNAVGHSLAFVSREPKFFVLSGYIMLLKNIAYRVPEDCFSEDAYLSYYLHNQGYKLLYEPQATVHVKYATNLKDWFRQKLRSVGGYMQLWKYGVIKPETKVRNFWKELEYFWFPIKYAKKPLEFLWSLLLYPVRLYLWLKIFYEQRILKKDFVNTWLRIESTK